LELLVDAKVPVTTQEWRKIALDELGMSKSTFYTLRADLAAKNRALISPTTKRWTPAISESKPLAGREDD